MPPFIVMQKKIENSCTRRNFLPPGFHRVAYFASEITSNACLLPCSITKIRRYEKSATSDFQRPNAYHRYIMAVFFLFLSVHLGWIEHCTSSVHKIFICCRCSSFKMMLMLHFRSSNMYSEYYFFFLFNFRAFMLVLCCSPTSAIQRWLAGGKQQQQQWRTCGHKMFCCSCSSWNWEDTKNTKHIPRALALPAELKGIKDSEQFIVVFFRFGQCAALVRSTNATKTVAKFTRAPRGVDAICDWQVTARMSPSVWKS